MWWNQGKVDELSRAKDEPTRMNMSTSFVEALKEGSSPSTFHGIEPVLKSGIINRLKENLTGSTHLFHSLLRFVHALSLHQSMRREKQCNRGRPKECLIEHCLSRMAKSARQKGSEQKLRTRESTARHLERNCKLPKNLVQTPHGGPHIHDPYKAYLPVRQYYSSQSVLSAKVQNRITHIVPLGSPLFYDLLCDDVARNK